MTWNWEKVKNYVKEHKVELLVTLGLAGASAAAICYGVNKCKDDGFNDLDNFDYTRGDRTELTGLVSCIDDMSRKSTKAYTSTVTGAEPVSITEAIDDMIAKNSSEELSNISGVVVFTKK